MVAKKIDLTPDPPLLLREVQTLVANEEMPSESVELHWVHRGDDGSTTVTTATLDEHGGYGNWPEDFDQTELNAEKDYLDAVESRETRK
jgi:hypothetical protein